MDANTNMGGSQMGNPMGSPIHQQPMRPEPPKKSSIGPVVGIIIVVLIIILGGLYIWGRELSEDGADNGTPSTSDEVSAIEEDLSASDFEDLDAEAAAIEAELQ